MENETKEKNRHLPILANGRGLALRSMDDMWRFACAVKESGLAPASFTRPEQILIAIQSGAELGLPPMRSLQSFCVVHGNARLWGDTPLALVRQSGNLEYIKEWIDGEIGSDLSKTDNGVKAICETKRKGDPEPLRSEFSVFDAKRAGMWNQKTAKGNRTVWMNFPERMLKYRARSFNLRDNFPDALGGATIAEEYYELPEPAYEATIPRRAERKEVESKEKEIETPPVAIQDSILDLNQEFVEALGFTPDDLPHAFGLLASYVCGGGPTEYVLNGVVSPGFFDDEKIEKIRAELANGIPEPVLKSIPRPAMTEEEVEAHAEKKFGEYRYTCKGCGTAFNKTKKGTKLLCPNCLSDKIRDNNEQ